MSSSARRQTGRILVVDDERNVRRLLVEVLEDDGHSAAAVASVDELARRLQECTWDLVLLDVCLPGTDGMAWLRSAGHRPAVIMMSGHATIDTAVEATRLGALDFLEKPISVDRLRLSVENALTLGRLRQENEELRRARGALAEILGVSSKIEAVRDFISRVAATPTTVLITGENGTGKELVARALHLESPRARAPFVRVNCAAIPHELLESEVFGHEKGAFSGAVARRRGRFEMADGGTLLLDEIGELDLQLQAKLLRVLEDREVQPVGGEEPRTVDVRVLAATNRDLAARVRRGEFREDLYYRLNVLSVDVPPLRDRAADIPVLAARFLEELSELHGRAFEPLSEEAVARLRDHNWPGNVRELRNTLERAVLLAEGPYLSPDDLDIHLDVTPLRQTSALMEASAERGSLRQRLEEFERQLLSRTLEEADGNLAEAARRLQTDRANLHRRLRRLGLRRSEP